MYVKLVDGNLEYAKHFLVDGDVMIINPSDEKYLESGFKTLVREEAPEIAENQRLEVFYEETEDEVLQRWEVVENIGVLAQ